MNKNYGNFPNPLAKSSEKVTKGYGAAYAKAILGQWGGTDTSQSLYQKRLKDFERARDYAQGTQSTQIYTTFEQSRRRWQSRYSVELGLDSCTYRAKVC